MTDALRAEARAILAAAASRAPVELERLQAFATECLAQSVLFRLANGVLRGGQFAPRRALDLAELLLNDHALQQATTTPRGSYF